MRLLVVFIGLALALGACGARSSGSALMAGTRVSLPTSEARLDQESAQYVIGVQDQLDVRVFRAEDLSFEKLVVDTGGNIQLPLIGSVRAAGSTAPQLASDIAAALGVRYLQNPQVMVTVVEAAGQKVTVDGAVTKPGVYVMRGQTSLLQAVAMAEGPTRVADLSKVAVFRTINGQRSVAAFDLAAIRRGEAEDPVIYGDDVIVVDTSRLNAVMRNVVEALPAFAIFRNY